MTERIVKTIRMSDLKVIYIDFQEDTDVRTTKAERIHRMYFQ